MNYSAQFCVFNKTCIQRKHSKECNGQEPEKTEKGPDLNNKMGNNQHPNYTQAFMPTGI